MKQYMLFLVSMVSGCMTAGNPPTSALNVWYNADEDVVQSLYYALHERDIETAIQHIRVLACDAHTHQKNIRFYQEECTALHIAFALGSSRLARAALTECGDNIYEQDIDGNTPHVYNGIASKTHIHKPNIEVIYKHSLRDKSKPYPETVLLWHDISLRQHLCWE